MLDPDRSDPAATGQSGRGSALFKHAFEHGLRSPRYREFAGEDHDRRRSRVYGDCVDAGSACVHGFAFGVAIDTGRAGCKPESNARADTTSASAIGASDITCDARSFTCGNSVIWFKSAGCGFKSAAHVR